METGFKVTIFYTVLQFFIGIWSLSPSNFQSFKFKATVIYMWKYYLLQSYHQQETCFNIFLDFSHEYIMTHLYLV